jgi:hypothetical protein
MTDKRADKDYSTKLPFWIHQIVEYALALVAASSAARAPHPEYPVIAAALVLVLAATADGPFAAFRGVPRKIHRIADLSLAAVLIVAALVLRSKMGSGSSALIIGLGALLAALSWRTDYRPKPPKVKRSWRPGQAASDPQPSASTPSVGATKPSGPTPSGPTPSGHAPVSSQQPDAPPPITAEPVVEPAAEAPVEQGSRPTKPIIGSERAENIGRGAGRVAASGVRAWRARKGR